MKCKYQETMLDIRRNIHISRCVCKESKYCYSLIHEEICETCPYYTPVIDELIDHISIENERLNIEELITICKECEHYRNGICAFECECGLPIRNLMQNPNYHCPMEKW